jgi:hypothetical protein
MQETGHHRDQADKDREYLRPPRAPQVPFAAATVSDVHTHVFDATPISRHRTFQVNQSAFLQGHVRVAVDIVITVAGTDVFFIANFGVSIAPPSSPSARTTMLRLVGRVEAFR